MDGQIIEDDQHTPRHSHKNEDREPEAERDHGVRGRRFAGERIVADETNDSHHCATHDRERKSGNNARQN